MLKKNPNYPIILWLFTGCFLIYVMVLVGGITRLTQSGLSMVTWSPTGSLPPLNDQDWAAQFNHYKESPEFKLLNNHFTLDDFKKIFWWEYIHRFIGRTLGIVFLIPFFFFIVRKKFPPGFLIKMIGLLLIGALQGLVGWYMVKSGLVNNPHVSHYRLATHLITAFTAFGFTFWFALDLIYPENEGVKNKKWKRLSILLFATTVIQIIYGAFVAGLKAGYLFPTFPKMGNDWIPKLVYSQIEPMWKNFFEGHGGVQFIHRWLALVIVILVSILFLQIRKRPHSPRQSKIAFYLLIIVSAQFLLGVATLLFHVPIVIALAHQTGAFFLFSTSLLLTHRLR